MLLRLPLLAAAIIINIGTPGQAQDEQGFVAWGMGSLGCETLVGALQGEQGGAAAGRLITWLSGYVSHANRTASGINDVVPYSNIDGVATVVARVCAANTDAQVEAVTAFVIATLEPLAVRDVEEPVQLARGEAAMLIRPSVLQAVQERLIERDLLPDGSADGVYGEQTAEALAGFQDAEALDATGLPDAWTVFLLLVEQQ
jgi:hypothetical protein